MWRLLCGSGHAATFFLVTSTCHRSVAHVPATLSSKTQLSNTWRSASNDFSMSGVLSSVSQAGPNPATKITSSSTSATTPGGRKLI